MKTIINKKSKIIFTMMCVGAILISSCKKDNQEPIVYGDASIRIVNTVSGSSGQDFYQGDTKISTTAVAYGTASSSYYTVKGGPTKLSFTNTGSTTVTASANVQIEEAAFYTVFYYTSSSGSNEITGYKDDNSAPAAGKARVRFLNLGFSFNNSLNVTYVSNGTVIAGGLGLGISAYYSVDPGTDLGITVIGSPVTGVISGSNFVAGKIYTVWFDAITATTANYHVVAQN